MAQRVPKVVQLERQRPSQAWLRFLSWFSFQIVLNWKGYEIGAGFCYFEPHRFEPVWTQFHLCRRGLVRYARIVTMK